MRVDRVDAAAKRLVIGECFMLVPRRTRPAGAEEVCPGLCRSLEHPTAEIGATRRGIDMLLADATRMGKIAQAWCR